MTYVEIVNAVLADAFDESRRADAKKWVNFRLSWLWDIADWSFKDGRTNVTVTAGSQNVTGMPADFAAAKNLWRADGDSLHELPDFADFATRFIGTANATSGRPTHYVVQGLSIFVGPTSAETSSGYLLHYKKAPTLLVGDSDVPAIPDGYHMALVHGAKAEGFRLTNVPLAAAFDADFQAAITAMQATYLDASKPRQTQSPAYRGY